MELTRHDRYELPNCIAEIVKEKCIDKNRFSAYPGGAHQKAITNFLYAFTDYENNPKENLEYCWVNFRKSLQVTHRIHENPKVHSDWITMVSSIKDHIGIDAGKKMLLIIAPTYSYGDWVYEGYIDEITEVLNTIDDIMIAAFYITSYDYDKLAYYSDDGYTLTFLEKKKDSCD